MTQDAVFLIAAPFAAAAAVAVATVARRVRRNGAARTLFWYSVIVACYVVTNSIELLAPTPEATLFWAQATYFFIVLIPPIWVIFSLHLAGLYAWLVPRRILWCFVVPLVTVVLVVTNPAHGLIWSDIRYRDVGPFLAMTATSYGTWFWIHVAYSYGLFIVGFLVLIHRRGNTPVAYRNQIRWVIAGGLVPAITNIAYVTRVVPGWYKDYSVVAFAITGIILGAGALHRRILDLMPLARSALVDYMPDGFIVVDQSGRVIDTNPAARRIFGDELTTLDTPIARLLPEWNDWIARIDTRETAPLLFEVTSVVDDRNLSYDVRVTPLADNRGATVGHLVLLRDITDRKKLLEKIERLATVDPLTGLFNRRHFAELASKEIDLAARYGRPVSFILIDLDHFKDINDTYGHTIGDAVLKEFSTQLDGALRKVDVAARYGGEEFVILLPNIATEAAETTAERLRKIVETTPILTDAGPMSITMSLGVTCYTGGGEQSLEIQLDRADQALYESKLNGRNRATVWRAS